MTGRIVFALLALAALVTLWPSVRPANAGGGCHRELTSAGGANVDLEALCFAPTVLQIEAAETVTWTNRDGMSHTVTGANGSWGDSSELTQGASVSHEFDVVGVYPYFCLLHPSMVGVVVVGGSSFAAASVSATGGSDASQRGAASTAGEGGRGGAMIALYAAIGLVVLTTVGVVLGRRV
jgi:plastocyanin